LSKTKTYGIWRTMLSRCRNPKCKEFKYYGERGVKVCKKWESFESFFSDMGECPKGFSIERKNVNGNYTPSNCLWIPKSEQSKNRRKRVKPTTPKKETEILI